MISSSARYGLRFPGRLGRHITVVMFACGGMLLFSGFQAPAHKPLCDAFDRLVLAPVLPEAPFDLRFFSTAEAGR
jgi:hypothetical protein